MTFNDLYYTASMIEYLGRKTKNRRGVIAQCLGVHGITKLMTLADVNHCLSMEQVADELIAEYHISSGTFDTISTCKYTVPSATRIGKVYARLADRISESEEYYPEQLFEVFTSSFSDDVSNFNSALFFAPADEIAYHYQTEYRVLPKQK